MSKEAGRKVTARTAAGLGLSVNAGIRLGARFLEGIWLALERLQVASYKEGLGSNQQGHDH
jgi:hypothetical protein